jgi:DUF4097 and DUF4098 domain-containing protein YvlB
MRARTGLVAILGLLLAAMPAVAEEIDREFHQSFEAPEGTVLRIEHGDGNVEIEAWEKAEIDVVVIYRGEAKTIGIGTDQGFDVEFRQDGKSIKVIGHESRGTTFGVRYKNLEEYVYRVLAPSYVMLQLEGEDGDVTISDWKADIELKNDDGDAFLSNITGVTANLELEDGDVDITKFSGNLFLSLDDGSAVILESEFNKARLRGEDGNITLKQCEGDFDVELDDGDIRFSQVRVGSGTIKTEDGDLDLSLLDGSALDLDVQADDGSVWVDLEEGMSIEFSVQSDDGRLNLDLSEVADLKREDHRVTGSIHGGKGKLRVRTADGEITIREVSGVQ